MLNVPLWSPPVPTTSIAPSGAVTRRTRSRIAAAKPASSSIVSPRIRSATRSAASWAGVASPSITAPIAARASSRDSVRPSTTAASAARTTSLMAVAAAPAPAASGAESTVRRRSSGQDHARRRERARRRIEPPGLALAGLAQEVGEQVRALRRQHRFGVELDALERQARVAEAHDDPVDLAHRGHPQLRGERRRIDAQRVVAGGHERRAASRPAGPRRRG